jgi:hypothetical protein
MHSQTRPRDHFPNGAWLDVAGSVRAVVLRKRGGRGGMTTVSVIIRGAAVLFLAGVQWAGGNLTRVSSLARYGCAAMPVGSFLWVISTVDLRGAEATVHRGRR